MIFNKVNRHELSRRFSWSVVTWFVPTWFQRLCLFEFQQRFVFFKQHALLVTFGSPQAVAFWEQQRSFSNGLSTFPTPPSLFFPSTDYISADGCLEWGLMAGLWDLPAMGAVFYLGAGWPPWISQEPTFHLSEAAG